MARPTKLSPQITEAILLALQGGNTRTCAAEYAGISYDSFKRWFDADTEFGDAVKKAEADCEARCVAHILKAAPTTWQAAAWWLERARRTIWARSVIIDLSNLTDDQIRALAGAEGEDGSPERSVKAGHPS